ncbi:MAG: hypothetical protein HYT43_02705 [Candidatus Taylorbacteria bacterium]|nr:hypothetical protein [Candidatus Taylorbacteria bacterium]
MDNSTSGNNRGIYIVILAVIIVVAVAFAYVRNKGGDSQAVKPPPPAARPPAAKPPPPAAVNPNAVKVIRYTSAGFSPQRVVVKAGQAVRFVNDTSQSMQVASDDHPTHTIFPDINMPRTVGKGGSYELLVLRKGSWGYHNHIRPQHTGILVIE